MALSAYTALVAYKTLHVFPSRVGELPCGRQIEQTRLLQGTPLLTVGPATSSPAMQEIDSQFRCLGYPRGQLHR